jgi:hypothetical protein
MENLLQLNSDKLKREIRIKMKAYEDMLQVNIENNNIHDLKEYIRILFYDTIPLQEKFQRLDFGHKNEKKISLNENKKQNGGENEDGENQQNEEDENEESENEEGENQSNENEQKENIKKREDIPKEESDKLKSLYKDPEGEFERYFENLFTYIENNENQLPAIKQKYDEILKSKFVEIHQKLKTCDQQIQFLESLYIQKELQQKIPLTGVEKISFVLKDQTIFGENNYGPSELFARYIFTIVFSKLKNGNLNKSQSTSNHFYSDSIFDEMKNSFQEWKPLLQFWFVYVLLIQQLCKKEANIEEFIKEKTLFELV